MRFIDARTISRVLTYPILIDAIERAHRRPRIEVQDVMMTMGDDHYFTRHAVDAGRYLGSKLITSFPANRQADGRPTVQAVCVLFDGTNGAPLAVLDGTEITYWRTSADSALASRLLSREDAGTLLVVGAGAMSRWLVRAHRAVRPSLARVLVWNRNPDNARTFCAELQQARIAAEWAEDLDAATAQADIITCCTASRTPLIRGALLRPGTHLDLVGGHSEDMREADDEAARRSRIFVDQMKVALHGMGDILSPISSSAIRRDDLLGDFHDLIGSRMPGRLSDQDITFFKNAGGGHLDLIACEAVYSRVVQDEAGRARR